MSALALQLSERHLRRLADERSFERGTDYLAAGRVASLTRSGKRAEAIVQGTRSYRVELWAADCELVFSCACPVSAGAAAVRLDRSWAYDVSDVAQTASRAGTSASRDRQGAR